MNILFLVLVALNVIALIILLYSSNPLQAWMDEFHKLYGVIITNDILNCYISEVSKIISFDDFMKKTDLDKLNFIQQFMQKCNPQIQSLGVKGKWSDILKQKFLTHLINDKMKPACAKCVIDTLEQNYDPSEIDQNSFSQIMPNLLNKCKSESESEC